MTIYPYDMGPCQMAPIESFWIPLQTMIGTKKGYPRQKIKMIFMAHVLLVENNPWAKMNNLIIDSSEQKSSSLYLKGIISIPVLFIHGSIPDIQSIGIIFP